jgi:hypothetical protein
MAPFVLITVILETKGPFPLSKMAEIECRPCGVRFGFHKPGLTERAIQHHKVLDHLSKVLAICSLRGCLHLLCLTPTVHTQFGHPARRRPRHS